MESQDHEGYHTVLRVELSPIKKARGLHRSMGLSHIVCPSRRRRTGSRTTIITTTTTTNSSQGDDDNNCIANDALSPVVNDRDAPLSLASPQSSDFNDIWLLQQEDEAAVTDNGDLDSATRRLPMPLISSSPDFTTCYFQPEQKTRDIQTNLEPRSKRQRYNEGKSLQTTTTTKGENTSPISLLISSDNISSFADLEDSL